MRRWLGWAQACDLVLDGVLGGDAAEFEACARKAFGPLQAILLGHLLEPRHGLGGAAGTTSTGTRFEFAVETETLRVQTEKGVGLEEQERFAPVLHPTGEKDAPEASGLRKGRLFALPLQEDEWLAEESLLDDEILVAVGEVSRGAEHQCVTRGLSDVA